MAKTKLNPTIQKQIGDNITLGMPLKFAAEAAGISEVTFYNWMNRGESESKGQFFEFHEYIKECQSKAVQLHLKLITKAATEGAWQASAWILERRHPEEFGRKDKLDMKSENKNLNVNVDENTDFKKIKEQMKLYESIWNADPEE